jgi:hypothetical protein
MFMFLFHVKHGDVCPPVHYYLDPVTNLVTVSIAHRSYLAYSTTSSTACLQCCSAALWCVEHRPNNIMLSASYANPLQPVLAGCPTNYHERSTACTPHTFPFSTRGRFCINVCECGWTLAPICCCAGKLCTGHCSLQVESLLPVSNLHLDYTYVAGAPG